MALLLLVPALVLGQGAAPTPPSARTGGPGVVQGVVVAEAGQPLAGAAVAVRSVPEGPVVAGKLTDRDGRFRVEGLAPGRYLVQVSLIGYAPQTRAEVAVAGSAPVELGTIRLAAAVVTLQGVEARGERAAMANLPDRTVYATRDMPVAAGGTATDALRTVPELEVDINGKVKVRGATPQIHINGRRAPMQGEALENYLQNLPANRIDRIEVIPNPSAKYEAEGLGGIVNIVMKEGMDLGLSGNVSLNAGTRGRNGASGRLNYQEGRVTFFGGGSLNLYGNDFANSDLRENLLSTPVTFLQQDSRSRSRGMFGSADLTAELKLSRRGTLWVEARSHRSGSDSDGLTQYLHMDATRLPTQRYDRANDSEFAYSSTSATLGFRHVIQPQRHEFSAEVRRNAGGHDSEYSSGKHLLALTGERLDLPPEMTQNDRDEENGDLSFQTDFSHPWGKAGKIELGYRGSFRDIENDQRMEVFSSADALHPERTTNNAFNHREDFHSAYLTFDRKLGRLGVQAGVRAERADTRFELPLQGESFENDYGSIFPNGNLSYDLGRGRMARLSYSKRIQRPWPWILNPLNPSVDPLNRYVGNPYLKPNYTHSFNLHTSWTGRLGTLNLSPYYRRTVDDWDQIKRVDEAGVSTVTWENLASIENYGASVSGNLKQTGPFSGFVSLSGYREVRDASNLSTEYNSDALRWSANSNLTMRVNSTLNLQGSFNYWPAREVPQGRVSSTIFSSFGARQQLWGKKASLNLNVMDPFNLYRRTFETHDRTHRQTGKSNWSMRQASLSFTYNFGRPPQSSRRRGGGEEGQPQQEQGGGIR